MRNVLVPTAALLAAFIVAPAAAADLESGLKVGKKAGAFQVFDCTGPKKGEKLCYR